MSFISDIVGTLSSLFQLGKSGPKLKNNSGIVEHRNAADSAYVITRGADPAGADDLVTKRYGDANYSGSGGGGSVNTVAAGATLTVTTTKQQIFHRKLYIVAGGKVVVQGNAQLAGVR